MLGTDETGKNSMLNLRFATHSETGSAEKVVRWRRNVGCVHRIHDYSTYHALEPLGSAWLLRVVAGTSYRLRQDGPGLVSQNGLGCSLAAVNTEIEIHFRSISGRGSTD